MALAILYNNSLEGIGGYRAYSFITLLSALIPLITIVPPAWLYGLSGWLAGKIISTLLILAASTYVVRRFLISGIFSKPHLAQLWSFSKFQFVGSMLSMLLMSVDLIFMERYTQDLKMIANYAMAQLFAKSALFLANVIGRSYFRDLVIRSGDSTSLSLIFLAVISSTGIAAALTLAWITPPLIDWIYGAGYGVAKELLRPMLFSVPLIFLWHGISVINRATGNPRSPILINAVGATVMLASLFILVPRFGGVGAVYAVNGAYATSVGAGLFLLFRRPGWTLAKLS
jgi:O-antigen/teichoic acid export membrane protein